MELSGQNVIYVGGFGGIGYESCQCLLTEGVANLMIFDLAADEEKLATLQTLKADTARVLFRQLDLLDKPSIEAAFAEAHAQMGSIDILINGSGIVNEQQIDRTVGINLLGPIYCTFAALPYMDKSQGGRGGVIATISSVFAFGDYGGYAVYTATKCALNGFSRALADPFYYAKANVAYVTVCPNTTLTSMLAALRVNPVSTFSKRPPKPRLLGIEQTAAQCARSLVQAVKSAKNGSVWILSGGQLEEYAYPPIID